MCEHQVMTKIENGMIISYCAKCGQILDSKMANVAHDVSCTCGWCEGGIRDNGGQILHD